MKTILIALLALGFPQENPAELVRKLGDELIETREKSAEKLIRLGEKARDAVTQAAASADPQIRLLAERILKTLDLYRDLRLWLAPPSKISLTGEHTLESACKELERQSGQKIVCQTWPEGTFRIDLKDALFWEALDSICAASGTRTPVPTSAAIQLSGEKYLRHPSQANGAFLLKVGGLERARTIHFSSGSVEESLALGLTLGWERSITPVRSFLEVEHAEDDQGFNLVPGFLEYEDRVSAGGAYTVADPAPVFCEGYHLRTLKPPDAKARVLKRLSGRVVLWIRAAHGDIELAVPEKGAVSEVSIPILDKDLKPTSEVRVTLGGAWKRESTFNATLTLAGVDRRMLKWNTHLWHLVDQKGRRYPGMASYVGADTKIQINFSSLAHDSEPAKFVIRIPPRMLQMEIPFSLKDIPVR